MSILRNFLEASSPAAQYHTPPPRRHEVGRWVAELDPDKGRRPRPETGVTCGTHTVPDGGMGGRESSPDQGPSYPVWVRISLSEELKVGKRKKAQALPVLSSAWGARAGPLGPRRTGI